MKENYSKKLTNLLSDWGKPTFHTARNQHLDDNKSPEAIYKFTETSDKENNFLIKLINVNNHLDNFCVWHSVGLSLTGQPFLGAAFARWLGAGSTKVNKTGTDGNDPASVGGLILERLGIIPFHINKTKGIQHMLTEETIETLRKNDNVFVYDESYSIIMHHLAFEAHMQSAEYLNQYGSYSRDKVAINLTMLNDRLNVVTTILNDQSAFESSKSQLTEQAQSYFYQALSNDVWIFLSMYILAKGASIGVMLKPGESISAFLERLEEFTTIDEIDTAITTYRESVTPFIKTLDDAKTLLLMNLHPSKESAEPTYSFNWLNIRKNKNAFDLQEKIKPLLDNNSAPHQPIKRRNSIAGLYDETLPTDLDLIEADFI